MIRALGARGNVQLAQAEERRFPGLLVQGDTLAALLDDLEDEAPDSHASATVREWLTAYEEMMAEHGLDLPYRR
jgi:hypothetical protein